MERVDQGELNQGQIEDVLKRCARSRVALDDKCVGMMRVDKVKECVAGRSKWQVGVKYVLHYYGISNFVLAYDGVIVTPSPYCTINLSKKYTLVPNLRFL